MNKIYKVIWSKTRNCYVVASELAKRHTKGGSKARAGISGLLVTAGLVAALSPAMSAYADYKGGLYIDGINNNNYITGSTKTGANTVVYTVLFDYMTPGNTVRQGSNDESHYATQAINNNGNSVFTTNDYVYGIAIGRNASIKVTNPDSTVGGNYNGVAIGDYAQATGGLSMALGPVAQATKTGAVAIGVAAAASNFNTLAMMRQSVANKDFAAAIGTAAVSTGTGSFAMGYSSTAVGDASIAIGSVVANRTGTNSATYDSLNNTQSMASKAVVIGAGAKALNRKSDGTILISVTDTDRNTLKSINQASNAVVIGTNGVASAYAPDSVVIGSNASVGGAVITRDANGNVTKITQTATGGAQATAIGYSAKATKNQAFALGAEAAAGGTQSAAVGYKASATVDNAFALGANASATAAGQAIGNAASVSKDNAVAIGNSAVAGGEESIAIGYKANVTGAHSVVIGDPDNVTGDYTFVLANNVDTAATNAVILGNHAANNSDVFANYAVAIGDSAQTKQIGSVALGYKSVASTASGIFGYDPKTGTDSTDTSSTWKSTQSAVSVGDVANNITRQITGVAAGKENTDAVNVAQLITATEAAATEVKAKDSADNVVVVAKTTDETDGHAIYTVSAIDTTYKFDTKPGTSGNVVSETKVYSSTDGTNYETEVGSFSDTDTKVTAIAVTPGTKTDGKTTYTVTLTDNSPNTLTTTFDVTDTNTHNNLVVAGGSSAALTVTPGDPATTGEKTFTIKLDEATLKENIDTNTNTSVVDDGKGYVTVEQTGTGSATAGPEYTVSLDTEKLKEAIDTNTTNASATITADNNKLKFSVKDSAGNTVTSNEVDISALASDTVLDEASTGLTISGNGLQLSVKDTAGNEVSSTVSLDDLKEAIDTNTNTSVVDDGKGYVTVEQTKAGTATAGPEYTVSLDTEKLKEAIDTNTNTSVKSGDSFVTVEQTGTGSATAGPEYTVTLNTKALGEAINTNTHNKLELAEGSSTALTLKEGAAAATGEKTYTLKLDEEALKEAIDTRNTVAAGDMIKVTEEKNADGSSKYTVSGADVQGSENIEVAYNANENKFTVTAKDLADTNLTNITNEGETKIKNIAQDAVKVVEGDYAKVTSEQDNDGNVTYTVSGPKVVQGNNIEVTYDKDNYQFTVATAADVKFENVEVTNEFKAGDTTINEGGITTNNITTENIDASTIETKNINVTENITYKGENMVTDVTYEGDNNTLYVTKGDEVTEYVLQGGGGQTYEGDNTTIQISEDNVISVIEGNVAEGDKGVVTGDTVYKETRVEKDGNYVKKDNTAGQNLSALDDAVANNAKNINNLGNSISQVDNHARKGIAGAAALAMLHPMDFNPDDKLQFSAGVGNYRGETAAAVGAFYRPDERVMFSIGGTFGNGDNIVGAGVTFGLDGNRNRVSRSRTAMAKEIIELRSLVTQMAARMDRMDAAAGIETAMFPDVPENHWAYEYVEDLQKRGALEGYPDGLFKGDRAMTRYEFAAMLDRLVRKGITLDSKIAKEFEPELGRIYVERISGQDNDRNKIERVRINDKDKATRDSYGSKIVPKVPGKAAAK